MCECASVCVCVCVCFSLYTYIMIIMHYPYKKENDILLSPSNLDPSSPMRTLQGQCEAALHD